MKCEIPKRNINSAIDGFTVAEVRSFLATIRKTHDNKKPFFANANIEIEVKNTKNMNKFKEKYYNEKNGTLNIPAVKFALMFTQGINNKRHIKNKVAKLKNKKIK